MPDVPLQPASLARYDTASHHREMFDGPAATPYRFNWRTVHGMQLAQDFKHALKRLEGLLYALWGGQPIYSESKQWYAREHPRCRWGTEQWWQQPSDTPPPDYFWNYLETAALGAVRAGEIPSVPVRSRSGDPAAQFRRADHNTYFPLGSVHRYCGSPGATGHQVHDPAGTYKKFAAWPNSENVVIRYTEPGGAVPTAVSADVVTDSGTVAMVEVSAGAWEATIPSATQDTWRDWYVRAKFSDDPDTWRHDPYAGNDVAPTLRGYVSDPEHDRPTTVAYSFVFFSHYNPYAGGLPELLDETPPHLPGNWLRRGTDEYRFDSSENIQPGLINLARFVLEGLGRLFQHSPRNRGAPENCCVEMPIEWRWSGSHTPDLYRSGGKDVDGHPLHNNPAEPDDGSPDARKSWRGIEMAWLDADTVPGFFPDNWLYGDTESWLAWPEQLTLAVDSMNPPWEGIVRDYGDRGLQPGDAIDPVHLQEIIDAVDYLCSNGLWTTTTFRYAKLTIDEAWGQLCGSYTWGTHETGDPGLCDENWDETVGPYDSGKCCYDYPGGVCVPFSKPSWEDCWAGGGGEGWGGGVCYQARSQYRGCQYWPGDADDGYNTCSRYDYDYSVDCNIATPEPFYRNGATISRGCKYREHDHHDKGCHWWSTECNNQTHLYGRAYYLCGPPRCQGGPDATHGNNFGKARYDHNLNFASTGPSMGNCFGELESCAETAPGEVDPPDFQTVVGVIFNGIGNPWWNDQFTCSPGEMQVFGYAAEIPGLGIYNFAKTDTLSYFWNDDRRSLYPDCMDAPENVLQDNGLQGNVTAGEWPVCRGDFVFVSIDLNKDGAGVPRLRDYDLGIANPFDDCPCETWTGQSACV